MLVCDDHDSHPRASASACGCCCGQPVAGRKFLNQQHYDRSKGLSVEEVEELLSRYRQGTSKHQLAHDFGVALSTVRRELKKALG